MSHIFHAHRGRYLIHSCQWLVTPICHPLIWMKIKHRIYLWHHYGPANQNVIWENCEPASHQKQYRNYLPPPLPSYNSLASKTISKSSQNIFKWLTYFVFIRLSECSSCQSNVAIKILVNTAQRKQTNCTRLLLKIASLRINHSYFLVKYDVVCPQTCSTASVGCGCHWLVNSAGTGILDILPTTFITPCTYKSIQALCAYCSLLCHLLPYVTPPLQFKEYVYQF
mgnify:CR=1 FL=1